MTRTLRLLLLSAVALTLGAPLTRLDAGKRRPRKLTGNVLYEFTRGRSRVSRGSWPGFDTALITFDNPRKLRPLLSSGRNVHGAMLVTWEEYDGPLSSLIDDPDMAGLLGGVPRTRGEFTVAFDRWPTMQGDPAPYTCAGWIRRRPRPRFGLTVREMADWAPLAEMRRGRRRIRPNTYECTLKGAFRVDTDEYEVTIPARVHFGEPEHSEKRRRPATMSIQGRFTMLGADMGLTGDDAGEIRITVQMVGFTDFTSVTGKLLKKALDQKVQWD